MQVTFIDAEIPEPGTLQEVAAGIFWLRMPLPFDLDHINLYLLEDNQNGQEGFRVNRYRYRHASKTEALWDAVARDILGKPITKVIVTHMHPRSYWYGRLFSREISRSDVYEPSWSTSQPGLYQPVLAARLTGRMMSI